MLLNFNELLYFTSCKDEEKKQRELHKLLKHFISFLFVVKNLKFTVYKTSIRLNRITGPLTNETDKIIC